MEIRYISYPGLDPYFEVYPWNPVFHPWSGTPDLGYTVRMGYIPSSEYIRTPVQTTILPTPDMAYPPEQVYMETEGIRTAQREQHAHARYARPRARIMRARYGAPGLRPGVTVG